MKLYIVRHGETDWNKALKLQGQTDIPLNEKGIKLAEITALGLKKVHFDYIFSSPLSRAYKTAEILRMGRTINIVTDDRLKEISFGDYEGVKSSEISDEIDVFFHDPENYIPPNGGETYEHLYERVKSFITDVIIPLSNNNPNATVLLVAHGALNKAIKIYLQHLEIKNIWDGEFEHNCCVNIYEVNGNNFSLLVENKTFYDTQKFSVSY